MKRIILMILTLCMVGLFWDDVSMRVATLEYDSHDNLYRRSRLAAVEKKAEKIAILEEKVKNIEQRLLVINPLQAKSNLAAHRSVLMQTLFDETALTDRKVKVFRTSQHVDRVEVAPIGSNPSHQYTNWGGHVFFRVGSVDRDNVGRTLLKFTELEPEFFRDKNILAAVLYIKQRQDDSIGEDDAALNETLNLYAVRKEWGQGTHIRGNASKGELTWISARAQEEDWSVPGCSSPTDDFEPDVLATSGPTVSGGAMEWVPIVFNRHGVSKLQDETWINHGYILKMSEEGRVNTVILFDSSKGPIENMPYLEIYYQDKTLAVVNSK